MDVKSHTDGRMDGKVCVDVLVELELKPDN